MTAAQIAEAIFDQLGGCRVGDGYKVPCPCHADKNPSLHISVSDDRILVHCHAGCDQGDVVAALKERQLWPNSATPKPVRSAWTLTGTYEYRDMDGALIAVKKRWDFIENSKPAKACGWYAPDGSKGVPKGAQPLLYRAERLKDLPGDQPAYVVEGEKCVYALEALGQIAVCAPHGAKEKGEGHGWKPEYATLLAGRRVRLLPDNDAPGKAHMAAAAASLKGVASEVKTVELPGLGAGEDIVDWLKKGQNDLGLLASLFVQAPRYGDTDESGRITHITLKDLLCKEIPPLRWVVPGLIPEGLTILAGKPKTGKSFIILDVSIAIACGGRALGHLAVEAGPVLYLALEDNLRRLQQRSRPLIGRGKSVHELEFWLECPPLDEGGLGQIEEWLARHPDTRMVVVDTMEPMRSEGNGRRTLYSDDYRSMRPLHQLTVRRQVAVVVVMHSRKVEAEDPVDEVQGTTGVPGGADSILNLRRKRDADDATLAITHRDAPGEVMALRFDRQVPGFRIVAIGREFQVTEDQRRIVEAVQDSGSPMSIWELSEITGQSPAATKVMCGRMVKSGTLKRADRGRYEAADLPSPAELAEGADAYIKNAQQQMAMDEDEDGDENDIPF